MSSEPLSQLADHDVVIGPADDGGYYLDRRAQRGWTQAALADLFGDSIPWGGPDVLAATLAAARARA